ncbi:hypothetical protein GE21DRAFT_1087169 [Neurospora crassa]|nr:hypothetical protein GE21DRAFT_1087169 [Neurospora crassa]
MRYLAIPAFLTTFSWGKRIRYAAAETKFLASLLHSSGSIRAAITYVSAHGTFLASVFLLLHLLLHICLLNYTSKFVQTSQSTYPRW